MKNFIMLVVLVSVLTISAKSFAQIFGVKAGLNLSNMHSESQYDTGNEYSKMKPGFHTGLTAELPVTELFSFETGLLLATKGGKSVKERTLMGEKEKYEYSINLLYLDVPLIAKIYHDLGGARIYTAFGPYAGMGLSGKSKSEFSYAGETVKGEGELKFGSDKNLKRHDVGLTAGAGVEISSVLVGLNYNLGLTNISQSEEDGDILKNRVLGLSIGYKFGGK